MDGKGEIGFVCKTHLSASTISFENGYFSFPDTKARDTSTGTSVPCFK